MQIILTFRTPATRGATSSFRRRRTDHIDSGFQDRGIQRIIKAAGYSDHADGWTAFDEGAAERAVLALEEAGHDVIVEGNFPQALWANAAA